MFSILNTQRKAKYGLKTHFLGVIDDFLIAKKFLENVHCDTINYT